jgi:hypothetical protein
MFHARLLSQRLDLAGRSACLEVVPGGEQLDPMDFTPRFHEPALRLVKTTTNELEGVDREDTGVILIVRVEVRSMVGRCGLGEHANDDPEESGDLRHPSFKSQEPVVLGFATLNELSHTENSTLLAFSRST